MKISSISVSNYRMLHRANINIEDDITLIVGKNNSGKTSFFEIVKMLLSEESKISFEDFSQKCYPDFGKAFEYYLAYLEEPVEEEREKILETIQGVIPKIELLVMIQYDQDKDSLVELSEFISDLNPARTDAGILVSYESINTLNLFKAFVVRDEQQETLLKFLMRDIGSYYSINCYAYDAATGKRRLIEGAYRYKVEKIFSVEEIKALRILDDKKGDKTNSLALGFSKYYRQRDKGKSDVETLEKRLKAVGDELRGMYEVILQNILDDLKKFGADTPIVIPDIIIDSVFDSEAVIKNNIKYLYKQDEIDLPESYNGLGYSNLIYMILEFASFIEKFKNTKEEKLSEFLLIMIEEPEAHMHPQMQQVFINQVSGLLKDAERFGIYAQLIITSHSSHIISEAGIDLKKGFKRLRYFAKGANEVVTKDFNDLHIESEAQTYRFLKQYLNLHKSDLFFADKVIIVEGVTEKLLMPQMISKVASAIQSEYITILEVGGAYTHKFKEILAFIGVKTLVITDLDSCIAETGKSCAVNAADKTMVTSNYTLVNWLPKKLLISELIVCGEDDKVHEGLVRIAFQVNEPQTAYYSRSFEEAFIERNRSLILKTHSVIDAGVEKSRQVKQEFSLFRNKALDKMNQKPSYNLAPKSSTAKTNFAFDIMAFDEITFGQWHVPHYIREGLEWLAGSCEVKFTIPQAI